MSEFAARWIFGGGPAEGTPFAAGAAIAPDHEAMRTPAFLDNAAAEPEPAPPARTFNRELRGRGTVEEISPFRLARSPSAGFHASQPVAPPAAGGASAASASAVEPPRHDDASPDAVEVPPQASGAVDAGERGTMPMEREPRLRPAAAGAAAPPPRRPAQLLRKPAADGRAARPRAVLRKAERPPAADIRSTTGAPSEPPRRGGVAGMLARLVDAVTGRKPAGEHREAGQPSPQATVPADRVEPLSVQPLRPPSPATGDVRSPIPAARVDRSSVQAARGTTPAADGAPAAPQPATPAGDAGALEPDDQDSHHEPAAPAAGAIASPVDGGGAAAELPAAPVGPLEARPTGSDDRPDTATHDPRVRPAERPAWSRGSPPPPRAVLRSRSARPAAASATVSQAPRPPARSQAAVQTPVPAGARRPLMRLVEAGDSAPMTARSAAARGWHEDGGSPASRGARLARATGGTLAIGGDGTDTVIFPASSAPDPDRYATPDAPVLMRVPAESEPSATTPESAPTPSPTPAPAPATATTQPRASDFDDVYEQVVDRLRRDLRAERERMSDLIGDLP